MSSKNFDTRNRILDVALAQLVSNQGKGVRMSDIAKGAGISRQALYLHFATRAELLIATTLHLDEIKESDARLVPSRTAKSGVERLEAFIAGWASYIPEIYGVAKALLAMRDTDDAAAQAWDKRMQDMREGCEAAIKALEHDKMLSPDQSLEQATDLLWTLLSVRTWEQLTQQCNWSQQDYTAMLISTARRLFVRET